MASMSAESAPGRGVMVFDSVFEEPLGALMNSVNPLAMHDVLPLSSLRAETFFSVDFSRDQEKYTLYNQQKTEKLPPPREVRWRELSYFRMLQCI